MKKHHISIVATVCFFVCLSQGATASWKPIEDDLSRNLNPRKILFIGNSYTFFNDLDVVLKRLAASAKPAVEFQTARVVKGGAKLEMHYNNPEARQRVVDTKWDIVILQEHSMRPVIEPKSFSFFAHKWENKPEMTELLNQAYTRMGRQLDAFVAPVGLAWSESLKSNPQIALYNEDQSHPNIYGTYLAACVFYATLTGQSPVGLSNAGLEQINAQQKLALQNCAWKTVQSYVKKQSPSK